MSDASTLPFVSEPVGSNGHHLIFEKFERTAARSDEQYDYNFMGARIAHKFERDLVDTNPAFGTVAKGLKASGRSAVYDDGGTYPYKMSEDYFEWIDLLTAIDRADDQFTMIEVGAGYGRWIANAAAALQRHKEKKFAKKTLIGLEADSKRFSMMQENCADNGISNEDVRLIRAGCTPDGQPGFIIVDDVYGNNVWRDPKVVAAFQGKDVDRMPFTNEKGQKFLVERVPAVRLNSLLNRPIDIIDMDIQGGELEVIGSSIEDMNRFVKMIHVGTHSIIIDARLCYLFHLHGWRARRILNCGAINRTPYGEFQFIDGIQSWENPRFD